MSEMEKTAYFYYIKHLEVLKSPRKCFNIMVVETSVIHKAHVDRSMASLKNKSSTKSHARPIDATKIGGIARCSNAPCKPPLSPERSTK